MPDETEPPRKFYDFKPRDFERANAAPPAAADSPVPTPDPGITPSDAGRIDVHDLIRAGVRPGRQLGPNQVTNRANEVHDMLRDNLRRDEAAGLFEVRNLDDSKRRRRIRNYWIFLSIVDIPLGLFAFWIGHGNAIPFVCAIAGIAMFTSWLTWETFFLRTHY